MPWQALCGLGGGELDRARHKLGAGSRRTAAVLASTASPLRASTTMPTPRLRRRAVDLEAIGAVPQARRRAGGRRHAICGRRRPPRRAADRRRVCARRPIREVRSACLRRLSRLRGAVVLARRDAARAPRPQPRRSPARRVPADGGGRRRHPTSSSAVRADRQRAGGRRTSCSLSRANVLELLTTCAAPPKIIGTRATHRRYRRARRR